MIYDVWNTPLILKEKETLYEIDSYPQLQVMDTKCRNLLKEVQGKGSFCILDILVESSCP